MLPLVPEQDQVLFPTLRHRTHRFEEHDYDDQKQNPVSPHGYSPCGNERFELVPSNSEGRVLPGMAETFEEVPPGIEQPPRK